MAWISVHEQVLGGKLRSLAKEMKCSQNEALGMLIRLWLWGINNADKEGRITGADKTDVAEVLTIGIDSKISPEDAVEALVNTSWIDIDNGLYIHDWDEWQEQWYKAIEVRSRDAERKRAERKRKRADNDVESQRPQILAPEQTMEDVLPSPQLKIPHEEQPKRQPEATPYSKDFEDFWEVYPRKVGKGEAYKKYQTRLKDGWSPGEVLSAAVNYTLACARNKTDKEYIKHAKTFLSDSTPFTDYLDKQEKKNPVASVDDDDPYGEWR